jgi:hypothetical protein
MGQGEGTVINGTGSQIGGLSRWGDYTSMAVDPTDDCTFWYTNQYEVSNGSWNWHTRIGSFTLPGCATQTAPAAPSLQATAGDGTVHLAWTVPSDGGSPITGYNVYRGTSSGGETLLANLGNVTSYDDTTVVNGTTYYYTVTAVNGVGEGTVSNEGSATPHAPTAPAAPTLTAATPGNSTVHLTWTAPSNGGSPITNYDVYRGTSSGGETLLATLGNVTSFDDNTAANGTTYYYEVSAKNAVGEGPVSNERSATPQPPPNFSLSVTPSSRSVAHGQSTTYTVTINRLNGFTGSVTLNVTGLPARTSASFSPNPASTTSTFTVSTRPKTPRGTYPLTIKGTSGSLSHSASVTLIVT